MGVQNIGFIKGNFKNQGNVRVWVWAVRVMVNWQYGFERVDRFILPPWLAIEKSLTGKTSLLSSSPEALCSLQEGSFCSVKYSEDLELN